MNFPPSLKHGLVRALICAIGSLATLSAQEQLLDGGFELSAPNGTFPDSGFWFPASAGPESAAICTTTAGRSGNATTTNGLWVFTGNAGADWWSAPYQEVSAYTGAVMTASAWVRTPPGEPWVAGSRAYIQVDFLGFATNILASSQSSMLTVPNTTWSLFQVSTGPAPAGTTRARYTCYLSKPNGSSGVSVVNFDDCSVLDPRQNLVNSEFEQTDNQFFPTNWLGAWLGEGGAVAIRPVDQVDKVLWQFTGSVPGDWFSVIHQAKAIGGGDAFRAGGSIRTPPEQPWVNGSQAYIRVQFVNASNMVVGSYKSGVFTTPNTNWSHFELVTPPAPTNAVSVEFSTYLIKPETGGQSVVNFDDCYLVSVAIPGAQISSRALGVRVAETQTTFQLRNTGKAPLTWQIVESIPWLSAPVSNGTVAPSNNDSITITVNRAGIATTGAVKGTFTLTTSVQDYPVDIYMDMPAPAVPSLPAEVRLFGTQMRVRDRLANGALSEPYHYIIKGPAWSPTSIGTTKEGRREEYLKWYVADIQLQRAMNANTVYVFRDFGTDSGGFEVLDNLYRNGMKAVVTVDDDGTGNSNRVREVVTAYRNHPAVLAWAIGNEWNVNFYHSTFSNLFDSATATESMARQVKALDSNHPVATTFADIDIPNLNPLRKADENASQPISTERIVNDLCPSVDFWGLNIYRGPNFGTLFAQWASITAKPMFFSEFGADAYRTYPARFIGLLDGEEDETMQATHNHGLWTEIVAELSAGKLSGVCLGGTVFEWNDEWWKVPPKFGASPEVQENIGYYGGQPDGYANEEWFAILTVDRRIRQSYRTFQADFAAVVPAPDLDGDGLPDSWEYRIIDFTSGDGLRRIGDVLPGANFDADRASNYEEFIADTDPTSALSVLRLTGITKIGQTFRLQWTGGTAATQYLEGQRTLFAPWTALFTNRPPTSITSEYSDTSQTNRFYRIRAAR